MNTRDKGKSEYATDREGIGNERLIEILSQLSDSHAKIQLQVDFLTDELAKERSNRAALENVNSERLKLLGVVDSLNAEIRNIRSSTSWRVTAPIRATKLGLVSVSRTIRRFFWYPFVTLPKSVVRLIVRCLGRVAFVKKLMFSIFGVEGSHRIALWLDYRTPSSGGQIIREVGDSAYPKETLELYEQIRKALTA
jgi:hypothetical protein